MSVVCISLDQWRLLLTYTTDATLTRKLQSLQYDLEAWREEVEKKSSKDIKEGFKLLDMEQGAGWALVKKLVCFEPKRRLSSSQALRHRLFAGENFDVLDKISDSIDELAGPVFKDLNVGDVVAGSQRVGGLTEGQLAEELGFQRRSPDPEKSSSATIAWWQDREVRLLMGWHQNHLLNILLIAQMCVAKAFFDKQVARKKSIQSKVSENFEKMSRQARKTMGEN